MGKKSVVAVAGVAILVGIVFLSGVLKGKGMVKIVTTPGDAQIFINGKLKGNSPAKTGQTFAIKLREGEYKIEVLKPISERSEFFGKKESVYVAADSMQTVSIELEKRKPEKWLNSMLEREQTFLKEYPKFKMVDIPAGKFRMGCSPGDGDCYKDEKPAHWVTLSGFKMSATEVTFDEWDVYVKAGGTNYSPDDEGWGRGNRPVINVSWKDVQKYIEWLNRVTGKRYSLPTEAQWEYVARAGTSTIYSFGNDKKRLKQYAWIDDNSNGQTNEVGSLQPNKWGVYDMYGNVMELCMDGLNDYQRGEEINPVGPSSRLGVVVRGGSFTHYSYHCRSSRRTSNSDCGRNKKIGYRLVLLPEQ